MPAFIMFGHELIHAWRDIRGIAVLSKNRGGRIPHDKNIVWPVEELQTLGIDYAGVASEASRTYISYTGTLTENGLRLEHGLNFRISYYGAYTKEELIERLKSL